jgi:hypothetical protein
VSSGPSAPAKPRFESGPDPASVQLSRDGPQTRAAGRPCAGDRWQQVCSPPGARWPKVANRRPKLGPSMKGCGQYHETDARIGHPMGAI